MTKQIELHKIQGTYREDRHGGRPELESGIPAPPPYMSDVARVEWLRVSEELHAVGLLTMPDRAAMEAYCENYAQYVEAYQQLQQEELVIETPSGKKQNPLIKICKDAQQKIYQFTKEFGMTTLSRSKIDLRPKKEKKNKWAKTG